MMEMIEVKDFDGLLRLMRENVIELFNEYTDMNRFVYLFDKCSFMQRKISGMMKNEPITQDVMRLLREINYFIDSGYNRLPVLKKMIIDKRRSQNE